LLTDALIWLVVCARPILLRLLFHPHSVVNQAILREQQNQRARKEEEEEEKTQRRAPITPFLDLFYDASLSLMVGAFCALPLARRTASSYGEVSLSRAILIYFYNTEEGKGKKRNLVRSSPMVPSPYVCVLFLGFLWTNGFCFTSWENS